MSLSRIWKCREGTLLALMLALFASCAFSLVSVFPVHIDEVGYVDPAASFVLGQGFTSGAWYAQSHEKFWSGNVPLHQLILIPWFKLLGFSQLSARSINILYVALASLFLWVGLRQSRFLDSAGWRLVAVGFVLCTYGTAQMIAIGRPDAITFLLVCASYWAITIPRPSHRRPFLVLLGTLAPWAGLQLAVVLAFAGIVVIAFWKKEYLPEVVAVAVGGCAGTLSLVLLYYLNGTLADFFSSTFHHTAARGAKSSLAFYSLKHRLGAITDPSFLVVLAAAALATIGWLRFKPRKEHKTIYLFLASLIGIPAWLASLGVFPVYYSWFALMPASLALFRLFATRAIPTTYARACIAAFVVAALLGTPRVFANAVIWRDDRVNERSEAFVRSVVGPDDYAIVAKQAYFGAKPNTKKTFYIQWYMDAITQQDKESLTVAIMDQETFVRVSPYFDGSWTATGETIILPQRNLLRLPGSKWYQQNPSIELSVFRKTDSTTHD
jgi:hypothetical protein